MCLIALLDSDDPVENWTLTGPTSVIMFPAFFFFWFQVCCCVLLNSFLPFINNEYNSVILIFQMKVFIRSLYLVPSLKLSKATIEEVSASTILQDP